VRPGDPGVTRSLDWCAMAGSASDTTKFCTCGWLERAAAEPSSPIGFDETANEYHLVHGRFYTILRFCPFCGCKAPESRRESKRDPRDQPN
jgi:hypothetical protein